LAPLHWFKGISRDQSTVELSQVNRSKAFLAHQWEIPTIILSMASKLMDMFTAFLISIRQTGWQEEAYVFARFMESSWLGGSPLMVGILFGKDGIH
jgi:hypothetical protein